MIQALQIQSKVTLADEKIIPEFHLSEANMRALRAIIMHNPKIRFYDEPPKEGTQTLVFRINLDGKDYALRVTQIPLGLKSDLKGLNDLKGIEGIPEYKEVFHDEKGTIIGLLIDYIDGKNLHDYIASAEPKEAIELARHIKKLIQNVHARNHFMPSDWSKEENMIVNEDGIPYLVDLGAHGHELQHDKYTSVNRRGIDFESLDRLFQSSSLRLATRLKLKWILL